MSALLFGSHQRRGFNGPWTDLSVEVLYRLSCWFTGSSGGAIGDRYRKAISTFKQTDHESALWTMLIIRFGKQYIIGFKYQVLGYQPVLLLNIAYCQQVPWCKECIPRPLIGWELLITGWTSNYHWDDKSLKGLMVYTGHILNECHCVSYVFCMFNVL
jgi:hypothetical protein